MNNLIRSHKDLEVFKKTIQFIKGIYSCTDNFPDREIYGLTSQLRRASISIASNLAEGAGRNSTKQFMYFLSISLGSLSEVETQLIIARELGYVEEIDLMIKDIILIRKMLKGLVNSLKP